MARKEESQLFFVTNNEAKVKSYRAMLGLPRMVWKPLKTPDSRETDIPTLAATKIEYAQTQIRQFPFFIEQNGLVIDAWRGLPGGLSKVFIEKLGCDVICKMLAAFKDDERGAAIKTIIYYVDNAETRPESLGGELFGSISPEPKGRVGFGWDRIFIPEGYTQTFAELGPEKKHQILATIDPVAPLRNSLLSRVKGTGGESDITTILFLSADPTDASRLRLGQELREIREKLQSAKLREHFALDQRMSVRPADISQALLDLQPRIVHFSGHGTEDGGLCLENEVGQVQTVQPTALAALFELVSDQVDCVLMNACFSARQAKAIAKHVKYVIGMDKAIGDDAAIAFTVGFYQAVGAGKSIDEAYKFGCAQIRLQNIPEHLTPKLLARK